MSNDLRVAICVPSTGTWTSKTGLAIAKTVDNFLHAQYEGGEKHVEVFSVTGSNLLENRHKLVAMALDWDATHILWVDSDMYFPYDCIQRLMNHGKSVVAANYVRRSLPTMPTAYVESDDYIGPLYTRENDAGLVEVSHAGLGLMLTHASVYDALDMPFFSFDPIPPHNIRFTGEDVSFCRRLRAAGYQIHVDHDVSKMTQHIGQYEFENRHAEISKETLSAMQGKSKANQMAAFLDNRPAFHDAGEVVHA